MQNGQFPKKQNICVFFWHIFHRFFREIEACNFQFYVGSGAKLAAAQTIYSESDFFFKIDFETKTAVFRRIIPLKILFRFRKVRICLSIYQNRRFVKIGAIILTVYF